MALTIEQVKKVADLARLKFTDDEVKTLAGQMGQILSYVAQLEQVETAGIEPMVYAVDVSNVLRDDVVLPSLPRAEGLANAPKSDGQFFLAPQVVDAG